MLRALILTTLLSTAAWADGPKVVEGELTQAEITKVLDLGPQRLVAGIEVAGHRAKGRFIGFRIVSISAEGPLAGMKSLKVGDIVITVNGASIERPDSFMKAWETVRGKPTLEVRVLRGVEPLIYRWKIVGEAK